MAGIKADGFGGVLGSVCVCVGFLKRSWACLEKLGGLKVQTCLNFSPSKNRDEEGKLLKLLANDPHTEFTGLK